MPGPMCNGCIATKCDRCIDYSLFYPQKSVRAKSNIAKSNGRLGSEYEAANHNKISSVLDGSSTRLTPNSGAGHIKGDQEINGLVKVMEELKEYNSFDSKGRQIFSIQKNWLDKLREEASRLHEFFYLKFRFKDDSRDYCVIESDQLISMIYTISELRKELKQKEG